MKKQTGYQKTSFDSKIKCKIEKEGGFEKKQLDSFFQQKNEKSRFSKT